MFVPHGHSPLELRWPCNGDTDYDNARAKCERTVWVDGATKELLLEELRLDKRDGGAHGRTLARTCHHCVSLSIEVDLGSLDVGPLVRLTFWRTSAETRAPLEPLVLHRAWSESESKLDSGRATYTAFRLAS